jgi:hypothetical protein
MTKPKAIPIPLDLQPGDIIHLRNGWKRVVERPMSSAGVVDAYDMEGEEYPMTYFVADKGRWHGMGNRGKSEWDIIRIERTTSAKPGKVKVKVKAKWAVQVICRSRAHAREAAANIDNGLRVIKIVKLTEAS